MQTFNLQTFKDVNMRWHVQSCTLVHMSGVHSHVHASSANGGVLYFTVQYILCIFIPSPECLEASNNTAVS